MADGWVDLPTGPQDFGRPTSGRETSDFGPRQRPRPGATTYHKGVDLGGNIGDPVVATMDGVIENSVTRGYGNQSIVRYPDGSYSLYGHMSRHGVPSGTAVRRGDTIGYVGNTGVSTGSHLHYGYFDKDGNALNPNDYFGGSQSGDGWVDLPSVKDKGTTASGDGWVDLPEAQTSEAWYGDPDREIVVTADRKAPPLDEFNDVHQYDATDPNAYIGQNRGTEIQIDGEKAAAYFRDIMSIGADKTIPIEQGLKFLRDTYGKDFQQSDDELTAALSYYRNGGTAPPKGYAPAGSGKPDQTPILNTTGISEAPNIPLAGVLAAIPGAIPALAQNPVAMKAANETMSEEGTGVIGGVWRLIDKGLSELGITDPDRIQQIKVEMAKNEAEWVRQYEQSPEKVSHVISKFLGQMAGDTNPTYAIGGAPRAATVIGRVAESAAQNAGISGATNLGIQGANILSGTQDRLSMESLAADTLAGGVFGGAMHAGGEITFRSGLTGKDITIRGDVQPDVQYDFPEVKIGRSGMKADDYRSIHTEITKNWTNAPETVIHQTWKDIPNDNPVKAAIARGDAKGDTLGWVGPDGRVNIIAGNLRSVDDAVAVTFHENLGHTGLSNKYGDRLTGVMRDIYETNPTMKEYVDKWIAEHPEQYAHETDPVAAAAEEVFAGSSENGPVTSRMRDRVAAVIKDFARQMRMPLKYSDNELNAILSTAHETVTSGKGGNTGTGYSRFMRVWHTSPHEFEQFDHSHMGRGEGFQVYGWGSYFAESPEVSGPGGHYYKQFERKLAGTEPITVGRQKLHDIISDYHEVSAVQDMIRYERNQEGDWRSRVEDQLNQTIKYYQAKYETALEVGKNDFAQKVLQTTNELRTLYESVHRIQVDPATSRKPSVYEVHIADDSNFLHLDKPLSEQSPEVQQILRDEFSINDPRNLGPSRAVYEANREKLSAQLDQVWEELSRLYDERFEKVSALEAKFRKGGADEEQITNGISAIYAKYNPLIANGNKRLRPIQANLERVNKLLSDDWEKSGRTFYEELSRKLGSNREASLALDAAGIHGNKFYDGFSRFNSRGEQEKTHNLVIFNDKRPEIIARYMRRSKGPKPTITTGKTPDFKRIDSEGNVTPRKGFVVGPEPIQPNIPKYEGGVNTDFSTDADLNELISALGKNVQPNPAATREAVQAMAEERGITPSEVLKLSKIDPSELPAAMSLIKDMANQVRDLERKIVAGDSSDHLAMAFAKKLLQTRALVEHVLPIASSYGQALNALKYVNRTISDLDSGTRFAVRHGGAPALMTPEEARQLALEIASARSAEMRSKHIDSATDKMIERVSKVEGILSNVWNLPKSLMSSLDLSAPFRQGLFLIGEKEFWTSMAPMLKALVSEKAEAGIIREITSRPTFNKMKEAGLALTDHDGPLSGREEAFISNLAEKIPLWGVQVRASERAFRTYLNHLRADSFDSIVRAYEKAGIPPSASMLKETAHFINNATGRGDLGQWTEAASHLNTVFFSPRLIASRLNLLNPVNYIKMNPVLRRRALKDALSLAAAATTVLGLARLAGADVENDPRSSDFAKIRVGNTRYDILGGFGQYLTFFARILSREKKNANGEITELGEKFGSDDAVDLTAKFVRNKLSPSAGYLVSALTGKDPVGKEFDFKESTLNLFLPMIVQDIRETVKEKGLGLGTLMSVPGLLGFSVQTYDNTKERENTKQTPEQGVQ